MGMHIQNENSSTIASIISCNQGGAMALHAAPSKNLQRQDLYKLWAWPKVRSMWRNAVERRRSPLFGVLCLSRLLLLLVQRRTVTVMSWKTTAKL